MELEYQRFGMVLPITRTQNQWQKILLFLSELDFTYFSYLSYFDRIKVLVFKYLRRVKMYYYLLRLTFSYFAYFFLTKFYNIIIALTSLNAIINTRRSNRYKIEVREVSKVREMRLGSTENILKTKKNHSSVCESFISWSLQLINQ